jgi:hypothetical protein
MMAWVRASMTSAFASGFLISVKSTSPTGGSSKRRVMIFRSSGTSEDGITATPIPARTAASTPLICLVVHVMRHVRPTDSSASMASLRLRLGRGIGDQRHRMAGFQRCLFEPTQEKVSCWTTVPSLAPATHFTKTRSSWPEFRRLYS